MNIENIIITVVNSSGTFTKEMPMDISGDWLQWAANNYATVNQGYVTITNKAGDVLATAGDKPE